MSLGGKQRNGALELVSVLSGVFALAQSTLADLDEADDDDERQRQELRRGKEVLHSGGRPHAVAVHKSQQHCRGRGTQRSVESVSGSNLMSSNFSSVTNNALH